MKSLLRWAPLAGAILLSACTYGIVLDPGGQNVRVAWNGNVGVRPCRDVGKVTVSVLSRIGPVDRNDIKVRDELEIMARNQAAQMHADTIVPLGEPRNGEQSWEGYACGTVAPSQGYAAPGDRELPPPGYHYAPPIDQRTPPPSSYPPGSGAPVEDVPPPSAYPPPSPPPPANVPQPAPFGAPVSGDAQTFPISGSSGG
ncbi:MAG TPA: DUF4156 domain-containing protein [Rhodanobacteraceae bacterium]|nr:DUF4156 domain-containing protein [Rhodanobacteraceae bacterium]